MQSISFALKKCTLYTVFVLCFPQLASLPPCNTVESCDTPVGRWKVSWLQCRSFISFKFPLKSEPVSSLSFPVSWFIWDFRLWSCQIRLFITCHHHQVWGIWCACSLFVFWGGFYLELVWGFVAILSKLFSIVPGKPDIFLILVCFKCRF